MELARQADLTFDGFWDVELIIGTAEITLPDGSGAETDVVARKRPRE